MGKGLSDMQKFALRLAYENKASGELQRGTHVLTWQLLSGWYGWQPTRRSWSSWHFEPKVIGEQKYKAGKAAAARTISRLEERGLVTGRRYRNETGKGNRYGYDLTEEGERIAQEIIG